MMKSKSVFRNRSRPPSMPQLRMIAAEQHAKEHEQKIKQCSEAVDFGGYAFALGICPQRRQLLHLKAELRGAHGQIGEELVTTEYFAEGLHLRVQQISARIGAIALGG